MASISPVSAVNATDSYKSTKSAVSTSADTSTKAASPAVVVTTGTNGTVLPDRPKMNKIQSEQDRRVKQFQELVTKMFGVQANSLEDAVKAVQEADLSKLDPETVAAAQKEVADDGYWGVEQTSARILDFAKAISGGDQSKIDILIAAVEEGFAAAAKLWGGELPEISKQTLEAVRAGFDAWKNQGKEKPADKDKATA